jgi:hypothetical protein
VGLTRGSGVLKSESENVEMERDFVDAEDLMEASEERDFPDVEMELVEEGDLGIVVGGVGDSVAVCGSGVIYLGVF